MDRLRRLFLAPASAFTILLFLVPLAILLSYSFFTRGAYGGVGAPATAENWTRLADPLYLGILWRSFVVALISTLIRLKPSTAKGTYLKSIAISSTMGPGVKIDPLDAQPRRAKPVDHVHAAKTGSDDNGIHDAGLGCERAFRLCHGWPLPCSFLI